MSRSSASHAVRPAVRDDLPAIVDIYNHYVRHTPVTFDVEPYDVAARQPWFEQFAPTGRHRLFVAEEAGQVTGYAGSLRYRPKLAYDPSVELTIYLAPTSCGRGTGTRLYEALFAALADEDVHRALAGISLPNEASVAFHERFGFVKVGHFTEQGRKLGRYWDVGWWERAF